MINEKHILYNTPGNRDILIAFQKLVSGFEVSFLSRIQAFIAEDILMATVILNAFVIFIAS